MTQQETTKLTLSQYIVYLRQDQREYLEEVKRNTSRPIAETVREAVDLHRDMKASAGKPTNKLTDALCRMIDSMDPKELQQAVKAVWAIREAYRAGRGAPASDDDMRLSYLAKYADKALNPRKRRRGRAGRTYTATPDKGPPEREG